MALTGNNIAWTAQGVELPPIDAPLLGAWIAEVARRHDRLVGEMTYIFCDDDRILEVNRQYLRHDYFTDIITFDYSRGKLIRGDMFISLDTVASNALKVGAAYEQELHRVIIHGVLHLCGINDKGPGEREIMELHENEALEILRRYREGSNR
jgi:rRNA maturation RNase YbeY